MGRKKTSLAEVYSARFNPIHPEDAKVIEIIKYWDEQGYNFRTLVSDRILRAENFTPEMFSKETAQPVEAFLKHLEPMLTQFAQEIISHIEQNGGRLPPGTPIRNQDGENTAYASNFARGFIQRQRHALGDEE